MAMHDSRRTALLLNVKRRQPRRPVFPVTVTYLPDSRCPECGYLRSKAGCDAACKTA